MPAALLCRRMAAAPPIRLRLLLLLQRGVTSSAGHRLLQRHLQSARVAGRVSVLNAVCSSSSSTPLKTSYRFCHCTMAGLEYPKPRRSDVKDVIHGVTVEDPYRWMEDPDSEETKAFVEAQNVISKRFVEDCPRREEAKKKLTDLWNYPKFSAPAKHGAYYYFHENSGLQKQHVLYRSKELKGTPEVFLDPNTLSEDGTISLTLSRFSEQGNFYCYGLSQSGSDWSTLQVKDVKTLKDLPEKLERIRHSSVSWTLDEKGFFYGQYPEWTGKITGTEAKALEKQKIFYHRLNTPQSEDVMCVEFPEHTEWIISPEVSECGKYLIVTASEGCQDNQVYVADISQDVKGALPLTCIYGKFDCQLMYITNDGETFYFRTNKDRPNYSVVKLNVSSPNDWTDVIPSHEHNVLEWADCVNGDKLVLAYMKDVVNIINVHNLTGKFLQTLPFDIGSIDSMTGRRKESEIFFRFTSFTTPGTIYRCDISKAPDASLELHRRIQLSGGVTTDDISPKQVFFKSKDGTKVPMFIVRRKDASRDSNSPCLLYVYGGFNASLSPTFSPFQMMLIKYFDFTVAIANVRGGGEYGEQWHNAGRLKNKQNTLDDVHAAAQFLVAEGYTKTNLLALMGGSNGGMVTTASINQRPELFGAAVAQVPVTDLFRFHKFTVGRFWCSDYGDPDVATDFQSQFKYSPLHNIPRDIDNYPSTLVLTADHDDRVVPSHSLKFIAELQHRLGAKNKGPLLALIDTKAGHGAGKPTDKVIQERVDIICFLSKVFNLK